MTWIASFADNETTGTIVKTCVVCGEIKQVHCTRKGFESWLHGALVQTAMPDTPKEERELLVSGTCGDCWRRMFDVGEQQEEEDEE